MMTFKWVARARILANLVLGSLLLVWPSLPFDWLGEPTPRPEWIVGVVGVAMIYVALAHVASAIAPGMAMSSNLFVMLGPILPIGILAWLGLTVPSRAALMLALYETVFVLLLGRTFQRGWLGDLAPRP
ncbi:MAG: hypothetical protein AB7L90_10685 [Hyphomicrobiaceae bacterium]